MHRRPIQQLDEGVANQIAAGEVVERPGSVVKELVENSIDAGATRIAVAVEGGGIQLIRVIDNGSGIPGDQVALAFARHATSKIRTAADLQGILSLGFRGEALPSIASVSHVTLRSRVPGARSGTEIRLEGGICVALEPVGTPEGTTVTVTRLFYNTPARRKFLKSESGERRHIIDLVGRLALAHPDIQFVLEAEGREVFRTPGDGSLRSAFAAVYDARLTRELLEFDEETPVGRLFGLVAPPHAAKGNRQQFTVLVNGRWIQSRALAAAVETGYGSLLPARKFPVGVLHVHIDPTQIDVNVHPAKTEIRFRDEHEVFRTVVNVVRRRLLAANLIPGGIPGGAAPVAERDPATLFPTLDWPRRKKRPASEPPEITWHAPAETRERRIDPETGEVLDDGQDVRPAPALQEERADAGHDGEAAEAAAEAAAALSEAPAEVDLSLVAEAPAAVFASPPGGPPAGEHWHEPLREVGLHRHLPSGAPDASAAREILRQPDLLGQVMNTYLVVRVPWGIWLLDQHVVHERILYEEVLGRGGRPREVQQLLIPLTFDLPAAADGEELTATLAELGFDVEAFGHRSLVVRGVPAGLARRPSVTEAIVQDLAYALPRRAVEERRERAAALVACKGAVKAGDPLSRDAILELLRRLADAENPFSCPHGRPVIVEISGYELERRFGRR